MEPIEFHSSSQYTLGVEIEFQILDRETLDLAPYAPVLQDKAPAVLKPRIAEEFIQSILEIRTGVCFTLDDVEYDLQQTCCLAEELAADNGCILHAASLHPFARVEDQILTDNDRYKRLLDELQLVGRQFISQGFHVHVGMPDGDRAVRTWNIVQGYLPLLLAASASSPFLKGGTQVLCHTGQSFLNCFLWPAFTATSGIGTISQGRSGSLPGSVLSDR